jgi:hypothetical protein
VAPSKPSKPVARLLPTGQCWCGCGQQIGLGSFFAPGHDKIAESAVILSEYGGVPEFLVEHGYGPSGKSPRTAMDTWKRKGNRSR